MRERVVVLFATDRIEGGCGDLALFGIFNVAPTVIADQRSATRMTERQDE